MNYKKIFFISSSFIVAAVVLIYSNIIKFSNSPKDPFDNTKKTIVIPKGSSFDAAMKKLYKNGLISNIFKIKAVALLKRVSYIKAGEYSLSASMTPRYILDMLEKGEVILHKFTIPEGHNIRQIAENSVRRGLCSEKEFFKKTSDRNFIEKFGIEQDTLEGYLFPDTYFFPKGTDCDNLISMMLHRFLEVFSDEWKKQAENIGFTVHEILTIASMIEKETGAPEERRVISSVFHNRLKKNMRLESDPTVIYGIEDFDGDIKKNDLSRRTPYNTYRIKGLPPGPIANPGKDAIYAALFPADTDFYFFVAKNDGTHKFSKNFKEHNLAVKKFQLK